VYDLGGGAARAFGAIRERIPGASSNVSQVVVVEVGERQAAIDLAIVVEYGVAITDPARAIRRNVIGALERMAGLEVVEVNVSVNDVHLPSDDDGQEQAPPRPTRDVSETSRVAPTPSGGAEKRCKETGTPSALQPRSWAAGAGRLVLPVGRFGGSSEELGRRDPWRTSGGEH
jgi:uncharacterized alkaline shock family protein YloU